MIIEQVEDEDLLARIGGSTGPRTTGVLHLSDIYKSLMQKMQPKRFSGEFDAASRRKMEVGLLFENGLERELANKFGTYRPGELVSPEGIYMSPDGVNPDLYAGEEYKCTWMSSRTKTGTTPYTDARGNPNDKFLHWFMQMKGYAKHLETNRFLLRVLHVNGDQSFPLGPQFMTHRIEFTKDEIESNWRALMNHAREQRML